MTSIDSADPTRGELYAPDELAVELRDVLAMRARWEEIPVDMIEAATKRGPVSRTDLERHLREAGYVYEIRFDAFMPPQNMVRP